MMHVTSGYKTNGTCALKSDSQGGFTLYSGSSDLYDQMAYPQARTNRRLSSYGVQAACSRSVCGAGEGVVCGMLFGLTGLLGRLSSLSEPVASSPVLDSKQQLAGIFGTLACVATVLLVSVFAQGLI